MEYANDDNIVLISAIEHYSYCERQCALIHVEKVFDENVFTLRGSTMHERVDQPSDSVDDSIRVERALPIWSETHGLQGRADVVEFRPDGVIFPVEYKIDTRKASSHDNFQLCAQAICLEEMFDRPVTSGAVFSGGLRHRREVEFTEGLRRKTLALVEAIRAMQAAGRLPEAVNDARCPNCSLVHVCVPSIAGSWSHFNVFSPTDVEVPE